MAFTKTVRRAVLGRRSPVRTGWVISALGFFFFTGLYALLAHFIYDTKPEVIFWMFTLLGVGFSVVSAYHHSGLIVSWLLVLGPVCGPLAFYQWLMRRDGTAPVGLIGSFYGYGAPGFYVPLAFVLGTLAFGFGIFVQWGRTLSLLGK